MGLFRRISDNIRANLNAMLDQAEDPEKMLNQYLRDMEDDIADAEGAMAKQLVVVRKFKAQCEDASAMVAKRQAQAVEALEKEREDLARKALEDKRIHQARAEDYKAQFESSEAMAERLKSQLREMKDEHEKMRAKRDTLVARARAAEAQKGIHGMIGGHGRDGARAGFDRMEDKVLQMEAEAHVAGELKGAGKSLDDELAALGNSGIDRELEEIRESLKKNKTQE